jgi:prepilin-type N-terminal cleavage/methylation domain-containing protein
MLKTQTASGFTLIETLVALALLLAGVAGATLLLLQCVQYERESSNRRAAIRFAASLAEELRASRRDDGEPIAADDTAIVAWMGGVQTALPAGTRARVEIGGARPARYMIVIEWPVAGHGMQSLRLPVVT